MIGIDDGHIHRSLQAVLHRPKGFNKLSVSWMKRFDAQSEVLREVPNSHFERSGDPSEAVDGNVLFTALNVSYIHRVKLG